ncbi:hypothetical protein AAKU67_001516 [Oxalobacteraceae bacterium GrIS 2.11]
MNPKTTAIYFYYPHAEISDSIPESEGCYVNRKPGNYIWTVKTYGLLKARGFDCAICTEIPEAGIIFTHRDFLPDDLVPGPAQLFICIAADVQRHPYAQQHLMQNQHDKLIRDKSVLWPGTYMPHWPESGLRPRDPARGDQFSNIAYVGLNSRLAPQLKSEKFARLMAEHGFQFQLIDPEKWNDYSNVDAVLAVRSFAALPFYKLPPTKLFNAWLAGVPALLGHESAYQGERKNPLDYFEVNSTEQIIEVLEQV